MRFVCLLIVAGCSVAPVDLTEKECPCAEPFVCDEAANRCVAADGCASTVTAEGFTAEWATAHVIRWAWTPVGERSDFLRYEIEVADDPSDLGTSAARIIGPDENPELGGFVLPRTGGADDIVDFTLTYEHDAGTTYVARLLVTDTSFCTFRSEMAAINTTLDPPEEIVLYDGPRPDPGFPLPGDLRIIDEDGAMITEHTPSRDTQCIESGEGVCSQNIRWSGMAIAASDISEGELANLALLEVDLDNATDTPSFFSRVWIQTEGGGLFRLEPLHHRDGTANDPGAPPRARWRRLVADARRPRQPRHRGQRRRPVVPLRRGRKPRVLRRPGPAPPRPHPLLKRNWGDGDASSISTTKTELASPSPQFHFWRRSRSQL